MYTGVLRISSPDWINEFRLRECVPECYNLYNLFSVQNVTQPDKLLTLNHKGYS